MSDHSCFGVWLWSPFGRSCRWIKTSCTPCFGSITHQKLISQSDLRRYHPAERVSEVLWHHIWAWLTLSGRCYLCGKTAPSSENENMSSLSIACPALKSGLLHLYGRGKHVVASKSPQAWSLSWEDACGSVTQARNLIHFKCTKDHIRKNSCALCALCAHFVLWAQKITNNFFMKTPLHWSAQKCLSALFATFSTFCTLCTFLVKAVHLRSMDKRCCALFNLHCYNSVITRGDGQIHLYRISFIPPCIRKRN